MIEHCIAALKANREQLLYRSYIADALKAIAHNTAGMAGENGLAPAKRFVEILDEMRQPPKEEPTGEQVIEHMKDRLAKLGK